MAESVNTGSTKVIAVCGKGGVGKTSISALTVRALRDAGAGRILAIDADPAVGLATSLGIEPSKTVDDIRREVIETTQSGEKGDTAALLARLDYEVFDALTESEGFAFLAVGRPEGDGCYCKVNSFLRQIIQRLASQFDYVVIDGEAGLEQINRRVMEKVTHLLLVSDLSRKGIDVIHTVHKVASGMVDYDRVGVILNRLKAVDEVSRVDLGDLPLLGCLADDDGLRDADILGASVLEMEQSSSVTGVAAALKEFGL